MNKKNCKNYMVFYFGKIIFWFFHLKPTNNNNNNLKVKSIQEIQKTIHKNFHTDLLENIKIQSKLNSF
jgi:hypothetical protein